MERGAFSDNTAEGSQMIKEAFLCVALAMPSAVCHFRGWGNESAQEFMVIYRELKVFLNSQFPGQEFIIAPKRVHIAPKGYTLMPIQWRGHRLYMKKAA